MLSVAAEPFDSDEAQSLVAALDADLAALYSPDQRFGPNFKPEHVASGGGIFLVAREAGRAVGCGALRFLDRETAEVKRMYAAPDQRGRGVGWSVLTSLEEEARRRGVKRLVLETGIHQEAAIRLYLRSGFARVGCWGEYLTSATSVCYEKHLSEPAPADRRGA